MSPFPFVTASLAFMLVMSGIGILTVALALASRIRHGVLPPREDFR